ncbi:MAG: thioredoxin family protein [Pseudomonadota bacterium]
MRAFALALFAGGMLAACGQQPADPPRIAEGSVVTAPAEPYDVTADATAQLDAAFARAAENDTRVLVKLGANWCPDCRILSGMMQLPAFAQMLNERYEVVLIDVGRYDRNQDLVQRLGFSEGLEGVPTVVIATADGQVINPGAAATEWRTARERDPQEALDYFHRYALEPVPTDAARVPVTSVAG